jgi:hypothetical protein
MLAGRASLEMPKPVLSQAIITRPIATDSVAPMETDSLPAHIHSSISFREVAPDLCRALYCPSAPARTLAASLLSSVVCAEPNAGHQALPACLAYLDHPEYARSRTVLCMLVG